MRISTTFVVLFLSMFLALPHADAGEALQKDWLYQADGRPTKTRIAQEIQWARDMAARMEKRSDAPEE
jgi:hypothetical protein